LLIGWLGLLWPVGGCPADPGDDDSAGDDDDITGDDDGVPGSYSEVAAEYEALEAVAHEQGPPAVALLAGGDVDGFCDLFTEKLAEELPREDVESFVSQILAYAPIGDQLDLRSMGLNRQMYYFATYQWGGQVLGLSLGFEADGRLGGLFIKTMTADLPYPNDDHVSQVTFELPFDGLWYVVWGGMDELSNYHQAHSNQAYAYDIVVWKDGGTCAEPCEAVEDYFVYGLPLLAPADAEVVVAVDGNPDMLPGVETDTVNLAGNHVCLEVSDDEFVFIAHMQPGSVAVQVGDMVAAGDVLGAVGNSGNTSEPHIHIHMQDAVDFYTDVESMPMDYSNLVIDGTPTDQAMPRGGQFVRRSD
jgi:hypothetical protein